MQTKIRLLDNDDIIVDYNPDTLEYTVTFFQDGHFFEDYKFTNNFREKVFGDVITQIMWERDIAIEQLNELGYGLGQRIEK